MKKYLLLFLIIVTISSGCLDTGNDVARITINDVYVDAEVADSTLERVRGLMYRENIGETEGMFFIFDSEDNHSIWMKNMKFPIDIIWVDENMSIVHIKHNVPPCKEEDCPTYPPSKPAKYVLEVKANFTEQNNIKIGDTVHL